jgi:hypothetical protein
MRREGGDSFISINIKVSEAFSDRKIYLNTSFWLPVCSLRRVKWYNYSTDIATRTVVYNLYNYNDIIIDIWKCL